MAEIDEAGRPTALPGTVAYLAGSANVAGAAYLQFARAVQDETVLNTRTRELVLLGIQTALGLEGAFKAHLPRAVSAGASHGEIMAVLMLSVVNGGVQGALSFAPLVDEAFPPPAWSQE